MNLPKDAVEFIDGFVHCISSKTVQNELGFVFKETILLEYVNFFNLLLTQLFRILNSQ